MEDIAERLKLIDIFNLLVSLICFSLGAFQMIITISTNIRDSMWELGVLRSIGVNRGQIMRITVYESISNTVSAITIGQICGMLVSASLIA